MSRQKAKTGHKITLISPGLSHKIIEQFINYLRDAPTQQAFLKLRSGNRKSSAKRDTRGSEFEGLLRTPKPTNRLPIGRFARGQKRRLGVSGVTKPLYFNHAPFSIEEPASRLRSPWN